METISMTIAEMMLRSIPIFLSIIIPGYLISLALFKKTKKFSHLEMFLLGIPFGMFVPSFLSLIEFTIGIQYSPIITLINLAIVTFVPLAYLYKENISILPEKEETETPNSADKTERYIYPALLLIILFLSFWIRIQSLTPYYYDFDPYWYNMAAQFIIQQGSVPPTDDYAWYPNPDSHRTFPFIPYMEAGWYHLFATFNNYPQFNFELFTMTTGLYPPIIAMLTVFFAYLWLSREYNQKLALAIAAILAFTPVFLQKTGAGSFEFTPFGMFGIVAFASMLALTLKYKSKEIAIATGFLLGITAFGSASSLVTPLIFAGTVGYIGLMGYLRNKIEDIKETLNLSIIIGGITLFSFLIIITYYLPLNYLPWIPLAISLIPIGFLFAFNELIKFTKNEYDKLLYLSSIIVVGLVVIALTPLNAIINSVLGMIGYVATNPDVTMKTIAEQTAAPSDFSSSLGILGLNIVVSITPFLIIISLITLIIKLINEIINKKNEIITESLIVVAILATAPFALAGLIKAKYVVFMGMATPILFGFFMGEILKIRMKTITNALFIVIAIFAVYQFIMFSDTMIRSFSLSFVNVVDNTKYYQNVCNVIAKDINSVSNSKDMINQFLTETRINSYRVYCNRIPDSWLDAILWIRDNVQGTDDRVMSWWDYGHWINGISNAKSVTGNLHSYTIMHQEVADKIVGNSTQKLIQYMKEHKAKYLLLDQDLIGKWGALVYHYCNYNNETTVNKQPGESLCDLLAAPEYLYIPTSQASASYCNMKTETGQRAIKVFSTHGEALGFNYYCMADGSLPFYYENKTKAGIENVISLGTTSDGRFIRAIAIYSSTNPDRKGRFYDSIFYKGFFEGNIPGMIQVYPNRYSNKPDEYVRIYKIH